MRVICNCASNPTQSIWSFLKREAKLRDKFTSMLSQNQIKHTLGKFNAPILTECATIKNVVSSAAKAETAALFHNCTTAITICNALAGLGHPQNKTSVKTDDSTANSFVHSEMHIKCSKSWDMKYNWL